MIYQQVFITSKVVYKSAFGTTWDSRVLASHLILLTIFTCTTVGHFVKNAFEEPLPESCAQIYCQVIHRNCAYPHEPRIGHALRYRDTNKPQKLPDPKMFDLGSKPNARQTCKTAGNMIWISERRFPIS